MSGKDWRGYLDPSGKGSPMVFGHKGKSYLDAGMIYAPSVPLYSLRLEELSVGTFVCHRVGVPVIGRVKAINIDTSAVDVEWLNGGRRGRRENVWIGSLHLASAPEVIAALAESD